MAIYTGRWNDEGGTPFDPSSFSLRSVDRSTFPSLTVTGIITPDVTGLYLFEGTFDGQPYWKHETETYYILFSLNGPEWRLVDNFDDFPLHYWSSLWNFQGVYEPLGLNTGFAGVYRTEIQNLLVSGFADPDCTGLFLPDGLFDNLPAWKHETEDYWILWNVAGLWMEIGSERIGDAEFTWGRRSGPLGVFWWWFAIDGYPNVIWQPPPILTSINPTIPDVTGTWTVGGLFDGNPYWQHDDAPFFIWWSNFDRLFYISDELGVLNAAWWDAFDGPEGPYFAAGTAVGNPFVLETMESDSISYGTSRLKISRRRHGSGAQPNYYPAGPHFMAGYYDFSPWQLTTRLTFALLTRQYTDFPVFPPVSVTGILDPNIIGQYGPIDLYNGQTHWANAFTLYQIWWVPLTSSWVIYNAFPFDPVITDLHWIRSDPSPYVPYQPLGGANGIALVSPEITPETTPWQYWGQKQNWLTRDALTKTMHGHAFWLRSSQSPGLIGAPHPDNPDPTAELTAADTHVCTYNPDTNIVTFVETFDPWPSSETYSGINLFEIRPDKVETAYEKQFTRLIGQHTPWPDTVCATIIQAEAQWPPEPGTQLRYFARIWHQQYFRHVEPAYTTSPQVPDPFPLDAAQWTALADDGTPCHGLVQNYRIRDWTDNTLGGCATCVAACLPPWNSIFPATEPADGRWIVPNASTTCSINSKLLRLASLRWHPGPPTRWELRIDCDTDPGGDIIFAGVKTTGLTPVGTYARIDSDCPGLQPDSIYIEEVPIPS